MATATRVDAVSGAKTTGSNTSNADATPNLGLPAWLERMLAPGTGPAVYTTLLLALVALLITLATMIYHISDPEITIHLYVFASMTAFLLLVVVWFLRELKRDEYEQEQKKKRSD